MNKRKIIFFLPLLTTGGAERVSINILNELNHNIYDIHLVLGTLEGEGSHLLPKNISIHNLESPRTIFSILKLRKKIKEIQPDIIFSSLARAHIALNLALTHIGIQPKVILRIPSSPKLVFKYNEMGKIFKFLLDQALKNATLVVAQTPEMKNEINFYHKINKNKIEVFLNPINRDEIDKKSQEDFTFFNNKNINMVASGRLCHEKGYDILIQAFKKVYEKNNLFKLFIIGSDVSNEQKEHEILIESLGLSSVISFLGFQQNPYTFYKHSDLFVLSSRREGLPNTVLENLYLKKPIIATNCIPFMNTLISDGNNGFLVPVEDIELLADAILKYKKIDSSYQTIQFNNHSANELFALEN